MEGVGGHQHMFLPARGRSKRTYSTMAAQHREPNPASSSSTSLFIPEDDHYENEHARHRPRLALPRLSSTPAPRFAGDGLDYRRPVVGAVTSAARAPVIDLTDDDLTQEGEGSQGSSAVGAGSAAATTGSAAQGASRLPRFGRRDIITLDDSVNEGNGEEAGGGPSDNATDFVWRIRSGERPRVSQLRRPYLATALRNAAPNYDEDLEIVSERTLSRPQTMSRHGSPHHGLPQRSLTPYPGDMGNGAPAPIDLTEDDDVVFMRENPREGGGINAVPPATTAGFGTRSVPAERNPLAGVAELLNGTPRLMQMMNHYHPPDEFYNPLQGAARNHNHHRRHRVPVPPLRDVPIGGFVPPAFPMAMPGMMEYGLAAFDMGLEQPARAPSPKYEPPPSPGAGFTRNPGEDDVVVCPNCGDELAVSEDEVKSQIWVLKACGHAYCGTCAVNRSAKRGKGKAKVTDPKEPKPFAKCVVEGCAKKCHSSKDMVHVYLGS